MIVRMRFETTRPLSGNEGALIWGGMYTLGFHRVAARRYDLESEAVAPETEGRGVSGLDLGLCAGQAVAALEGLLSPDVALDVLSIGVEREPSETPAARSVAETRAVSPRSIDATSRMAG